MDEDNCLQLLILKKIRSDLEAILSKVSDAPPEKHTDRDLLQTIFQNYRYKNNQHHGLRLTYVGLQVLKKQFDCYGFNIEEKPTHQAFLRLDKSMQWPYYISKRKAIFFNENDAAWFKLNGGDLTSFTEYI